MTKPDIFSGLFLSSCRKTSPQALVWRLYAGPAGVAATPMHKPFLNETTVAILTLTH